MRKCGKCGNEMVNAFLHAEPFSMELDHEIDSFSIGFVNGTQEVKNIFGKTKVKENVCVSKLNAAVCLKCGQVELYIDLDEVQ